MKRILTHEQRTRLMMERRAQRMANRDRDDARRYVITHMILARGPVAQARRDDTQQIAMEV